MSNPRARTAKIADSALEAWGSCGPFNRSSRGYLGGSVSAVCEILGAWRQRSVDAIAVLVRTEQLAAPAPLTAAFAATTRAAVSIIVELNRQIAELETELATHIEAHPHADTYLSGPGLGVVIGARMLGEFRDDPNRYTNAKSRNNYAGTSPMTVASGKKRATAWAHRTSAAA